MTVTNLFNTSLETIKIHIKKVILFSAAASILRFASQYLFGEIPYFFLIFPFLWYFLVVIPFIKTIGFSDICHKKHIKSGLLMGVIDIISSSLYTLILLFLAYIRNLAGEYLGIYNLIVIASLPLLTLFLIVRAIAECLFVFPVLTENSFKNSVKLLFSKLRGHTLKKAFIILLLSNISEWFFKLLSIPLASFTSKTNEINLFLNNSPIGTFLFLCEIVLLYNYWTKES